MGLPEASMLYDLLKGDSERAMILKGILRRCSANADFWNYIDEIDKNIIVPVEDAKAQIYSVIKDEDAKALLHCLKDSISIESNIRKEIVKSTEKIKEYRKNYINTQFLNTVSGKGPAAKESRKQNQTAATIF